MKLRLSDLGSSTGSASIHSLPELTAIQDGSQTFTLSLASTLSGVLDLNVLESNGGVRALYPSEYSLTGTTLTVLSTANILTGDRISGAYFKAGVDGGDAPQFLFDATTRTLLAYHALGAGELEVSRYDGPYSAYAPVTLSDTLHPAGEWKVRVRAASGRTAGSPTPSPAIDSKTLAANLVRLNITITGGDMSSITDVKKTVALAFSNSFGSAYPSNQLYTGPSTIKIRGNFTATLPKKAYSLTFAKTDGSDQKFALMGMYNDSDYVLLAEYADPSFLRTFAIQTFSALTGLTTVKTRPVEVYCNGAYHGLYTLTEKIKQSSSLVETLGTGTGDQTTPNITGGYLLQKVADYQEDFTEQTHFKSTLYNDNTQGPNGTFARSVVIEYPKFGKITTAQTNYITSYVNTAESSLSQPWNDLTNGPQAYFEPVSLVKYFFVQEFGKNWDGESQSSYYLKRRGGRIECQLPWDFDITFPIYTILQGAMSADPTEPWIPKTPWFKLLFQDADFKAYVKSQFASLYPLFAEAIDQLQLRASLLKATGAADRDNAKWNSRGDDKNYFRSPNGPDQNYQHHVDQLVTYAKARLNWMLSYYGS